MPYSCRTGLTNWSDAAANRFHSVSSASDEDLLTDARETKKAMPGRYSLTVLCAVTIIGLLGCQSGPRWAWWKDSGTPPTDTSLVARTAVDSAGTASSSTDPAGVVAPDSSELVSDSVIPNAVQETGRPSAQATPQTIAARTGPTQSPPAAVAQNSVAQNSVAQNSVAQNSVAQNSVAQNSVAQNSVAQNSGPGVLPPGSAGTIAQAPIASYAPPVTPPPSVPSAPSTAPPSASSVASVAVPTSPTPKLAGPYDPARYQAPRSPRTAAAPGGSPPGRYPMTARNDRYSTNTGPPTGLSDRYAAPLAGGNAPIASGSQQTAQTKLHAAGSSLATVPTARQTEPGQMNAGRLSAGSSTISVGDRYAASPPTTGPATVSQAGGPPAAAAIHQAVPQVSSVATVEATTPAGQYRPGGTSTYPSEQVELARRPAPTGSVGGPQAEGVTVPPTRYPGYTPARPTSAPATRTY